MNSSLAQKTAHLKWLKAIRASSGAVPQESQVRDCDCRIWLKQQAKKQAVHKPRVVEAKHVELVLLASAAPKAQRDSDYNRRFEQGSAGWYHIPARSVQNYSDEQLRDVAYLAIGTTQAGTAERSAHHLYAVSSVQNLPRHMLTVEQSGSLVASAEPYWLFELSHSVVLAQAITHYPQTFSAKLAVASQLLSHHNFADIIDVNALV
ncbi:MAG: hypothetical protein B7Z48_04380 [Thiotrichales bacterium 12-47-6]|nr:MAG: hypothetical protein B7Z48_04380 [Thiotrichales bacterium 12-47-6]HQT02153.1 hypothetical protein [Thiotrichales bacterium]